MHILELPTTRRKSVYFLQSPSTGLIKIGFSTDTRARWSVLCREYAERLVLLGAVEQEASPSMERRLHRKFSAIRVYYEWFLPTPEIVLLAFQFASNIEAQDCECLARKKPRLARHWSTLSMRARSLMSGGPMSGIDTDPLPIPLLIV